MREKLSSNTIYLFKADLIQRVADMIHEPCSSFSFIIPSNKITIRKSGLKSEEKIYQKLIEMDVNWKIGKQTVKWRQILCEGSFFSSVIYHLQQVIFCSFPQTTWQFFSSHLSFRTSHLLFLPQNHTHRLSDLVFWLSPSRPSCFTTARWC